LVVASPLFSGSRSGGDGVKNALSEVRARSEDHGQHSAAPGWGDEANASAVTFLDQEIARTYLLDLLAGQAMLIPDVGLVDLGFPDQFANVQHRRQVYRTAVDPSSADERASARA
jgi:hypothetical protein